MGSGPERIRASLRSGPQAEASRPQLAQPSSSVLPTKSSEPILIPKLQIQFADFPYLHYSNRPEAANLGDLMRLLVRPGVE